MYRSAQARPVASDRATTASRGRMLAFAGYDWFVRANEVPAGPGPNRFSDSPDNVYVDAQGQLHLRITERNGRWYCAEVICAQSFGYGRYLFYLASAVDQLHENVVAGLFTWHDAPVEHHREIDIEFSRWGNRAYANAHFVVQPWQRHGRQHSFQLRLNGTYSTHSFEWRPQGVYFRSVHDHYAQPPSASYHIAAWSYSGDELPTPGGEHVRINLWIYDADRLPSEAELVVKHFEFLPL